MMMNAAQQRVNAAFGEAEGDHRGRISHRHRSRSKGHRHHHHHDSHHRHRHGHHHHHHDSHHDHHYHHGDSNRLAPPCPNECIADEDVFIQEAQRLTDPNELPPPHPSDFPHQPLSNFRRPVQKTLEVPVTRKVKVPVTTQQAITTTELVPQMHRKTVLETHVEVVDEPYTEMVERQGTRFREMWVRTVVPENYTYSEQVQLHRQVLRPQTRAREVHIQEMVPQQVTKMIDVPGYRVDEVVENKLVSVDGWQEFRPVVQYVPGPLKYEHAHYSGDSGRRQRLEGEVAYSPEHVVGIPHQDAAAARIPSSGSFTPRANYPALNPPMMQPIGMAFKPEPLLHGNPNRYTNAIYDRTSQSPAMFGGRLPSPTSVP